MAFMKARLDRFEEYVNEQKLNYLDSFSVLTERFRLKEKLIEQVEKDPGFLADNPILKMYYLADKDRGSCFFLVDYFERGNALDGLT